MELAQVALVSDYKKYVLKDFTKLAKIEFFIFFNFLSKIAKFGVFVQITKFIIFGCVC